MQPGIAVVNANIEKVIAWKNGLFNFDGASLYETMRQIERWYDIDVVYEKGSKQGICGELTKALRLINYWRGLRSLAALQTGGQNTNLTALVILFVNKYLFINRVSH